MRAMLHAMSKHGVERLVVGAAHSRLLVTELLREGVVRDGRDGDGGNRVLGRELLQRRHLDGDET